MKSPFPGMDPYLERYWDDVHPRLAVYACDVLQPRLPADLYARVEGRLVVDSRSPIDRQIAPDAVVTERESWESGADAGGVAVAEPAAAVMPLIIEMADLEVTERFIEIHEMRGDEPLVTAIEFLSPANKRGGDGSKKYAQKQAEVLVAGANLVEIDLVRAGRYMLAAPEDRVPEAMRRDYLACITAAAEGWRRHEVHPLSIRRPLPALPIPLRKSDPRIALDLQALLDHAYEAGRYARFDYSRPPDPPLAPETAAWAESLTRGLAAAVKPPGSAQ